MALRLEDRKPLIDIIERTPAIPDSCQWGIFLRNHDELTLEMVTDVERAYMWDEYAQDPRARINLGIRRRLAPLMEGDRRRIELMNGLLMSLPGSPIMYYGDEIGMGDNVYLGDRNGVRTPMQWNSGWNAGFSTADPERLWLPLISNAVYGYQAINVESQQRNATSLLNWTRRLIEVRRSTPVFGRGSIEFLKPANHRVLAFTRTLGRETRPRGLQSGGHGAGRGAGSLARWPAPSRSRCSAAASFRASARAIHHDAGSVRLLLVPAALAVDGAATADFAESRRRRPGTARPRFDACDACRRAARERPFRRVAPAADGRRPGGRSRRPADAQQRRDDHRRRPRDPRVLHARFSAPAHGHDQLGRRLDRRHAGADPRRDIQRGRHGADLALAADAASRRRAVPRPARASTRRCAPYSRRRS